MPLILRWKGHTPAGRVDDESVLGAVDLLPTLCRLAAAPAPAGLPLDGEDVSEALHGRVHRRQSPLLWEWRFPVAGHPIHKSPRLAIRDGDWKLLLNPDRSRTELYDIPRDPMELRDLAARHPETAERLATRALAWASGLPPGPVSPLAGSNAYAWPAGSPPAAPSPPRSPRADGAGQFGPGPR
jgi:arylsulfatase A-like enzyme